MASRWFFAFIYRISSQFCHSMIGSQFRFRGKSACFLDTSVLLTYTIHDGPAPLRVFSPDAVLNGASPFFILLFCHVISDMRFILIPSSEAASRTLKSWSHGAMIGFSFANKKRRVYCSPFFIISADILSDHSSPADYFLAHFLHCSIRAPAGVSPCSGSQEYCFSRLQGNSAHSPQ